MAALCRGAVAQRGSCSLTSFSLCHQVLFSGLKGLAILKTEIWHRGRPVAQNLNDPSADPK